MTNAFSRKKLTSKLSLVYLQVKLQEYKKLRASAALIIKTQKNIRNKIYTSEQAPNKVAIFLFDVKML